MRAGHYAVVDGVTYRCERPQGPAILLLAPVDEPQPDGFARDNRGRWRRRVTVADVSRVFFVRTTAIWKGKRVKVDAVLGDDAAIEYTGTDIDGRPELSQREYGVWAGGVTVGSLSDADEEVLEFQL
ncbi:hypothetical protein [Georgenia sunbinii]|uniref:hypothetical protein n=1 Tax=Georgenia sunbinii TaxID=3117728 RepID=UPI002F26DA97